MNGQRIGLSVIIPCYNNEATIGRCLEAILAQEYKPDEIIVVDDGSSDRSAEIAGTYPAKVVRQEQNLGAASSRALGASMANGEVLAFTDADCVAPSDWTQKIVDEFIADPQLGGLGGSYVHPIMKSYHGKMAFLEEAYIFQVFKKFPKHAPACGGTSAFRKSAWDLARSGRELEIFKGMGSGEDCVVSSEVKRYSKVKYRHDLSVLHYSKAEGGYFRRHLNRGYSRSSILAHRLSSKEESSLIFKSYGGWPLFLSTFFWGCLLLSLAALPFYFFPALMAASISLAFHLFCAHEFFSFTRIHERETLPPELCSTFFDRLVYRFFLFTRSLMWIWGTLRGVWVYLSFQIARYWNITMSILHFWTPGRISKLFYFVTSHCNARCSFCFNLDNVVSWKEKRKAELSLEEVSKIASGFGRLPFVTFSGGEPFLRKDLPLVVETFHEQAKTYWVTIPTNAALTKIVLGNTKEILRRCPGLFLTIQVSIDSLGTDHNTSRGLNNGFQELCETLRGLKEIRKLYPNIRIQIATCYDDFNADRMQEIIEFCRENFDYDQQIFYLIRKTHEPITKENNHLIGSYVDLLRQNEKRERREHQHSLWARSVRALQAVCYRDIVNIKLRGDFIRPCVATQKFVTLWDDGKVSPCEILEKQNLGNLKSFNYNYYDMKRAQGVAAFHKREIVAKKCSCDWLCAPPINMLYDPKTFKDIVMSFFAPTRLDKREAGHLVEKI